MSIFRSCSHDFRAAAIFMLASVVFDFLDGKTARYFNQATFFGKGLDSLSDVISFGLAPAAFGYAMIPSPFFAVLAVLSLFVFAGAWRLAYYMQWSGKGRPPGMPITANGFGFPVAFFAHLAAPFFLSLYFVSTCLMVGPIFVSRHPIS